MQKQVLRPRGILKCAGFTLAELLVVVGIMTVLLVVTIPAFSAAIRSYRSSSGVNVVQAALKAARTSAIRHHKLFSVEFRSESEGDYMVCEEERGADPDQPRGQRNYLPQDVTFDRTETYRDSEDQDVSWTIVNGWVGNDDATKDLATPPAPQQTLDVYDGDIWPAKDDAKAVEEGDDQDPKVDADVAFRSDGTCVDKRGETTVIIEDATDPDNIRYWKISVLIPSGQVETERVYKP